MARLFHAFDRQNYMELCAQHLADVWQLPPTVKQHFVNGAFTVSVLGVSNHGQAVDEAHESVVNRQTKAVLHRAEPDYIEQIAHYLPFRAQMQENLRQQVVRISSDSNTMASTHAHPGNVTAMCNTLSEAQPFKRNGVLQNIFSGRTATPAEQRGMLECHDLGDNKLANYFSSRLMRMPSIDTPVRMERLQTMCTRQKKKRGLKKVPKPHKITVLALKAELLQAKQLNRPPTIHQQVFILPRALVDDNGYPRKGAKAVTRKVIATRYSGILSSSLPDSLQGNKQETAVVIDGMFLLQTKPLSHHRLMADYVAFLLARWVLPMFAQANHVHLLWDDPNRHGPSAKDVERQRRDTASEDCLTCEHKAIQLNSLCPTGAAWQSLIKCRTCKRNVVSLITCGSLVLMQVQALQPGQVFVVVGGLNGGDRDQAWCVEAGSPARREPLFEANHEEADTRVWFHALRFAKAIIYSPDTDTFMVGLPLIQKNDCKIAVRLDMPGSKEQIYLNMNMLAAMINRDPDLAMINEEHRCAVLQACYVASGCDFTSFFAGVGKATFFTALFKYTSFVCLGPGFLHNINDTSSFLAFIRLVTSAYYCRFRSAFNSSPADVFAELSGTGQPEERHKRFLEEVQRAIWPRATG